MNHFFLYLLITAIFSMTYFSEKVAAQVITLQVPIIEENPHQHKFFHELLETAIKEAGHTPNLIVQRLPQLRVKSYLGKGILSLYWMIESEQRNKDYIAIEVGITNKLIGKRLLLINPADQHLYNHVTDLDSFRKLNLEAHLGKKWFDATVWAANDLRYNEHAKWKKIFAMIAQGSRHHYFPRGINEIIGELKQHPDLAIEKNLMLIYDRDFRFYLSKTGPNAGKKHQKILTIALENAQKNGLIERLIMKHWSKNLNELNYDGRIKIRLKTPKRSSDGQ